MKNKMIEEVKDYLEDNTYFDLDIQKEVFKNGASSLRVMEILGDKFNMTDKRQIINVLGTEYKIKENCSIEDYSALRGSQAYTDPTTKQIIIREIVKDDNSVSDLQYHLNSTKRHEIIHAFLYESGLDGETWARNEEMVDWFAIQYPKISKAFNKLNIGGE